MSTTTYLLNICTIMKLEKIYRRKHGMDLNCKNHLIILDFLAYRDVLGKLIKKLDDKGELMILEGITLLVVISCLMQRIEGM